MLGTAADEIAWSNEVWKSSNVTALREQQETDFGNWGPEEFKMPQKTEGDWDSVTTNSGRVLANKVIGILSSSSLQLFIDSDEENVGKRKVISNTEYLANGAIWEADRRATLVPSGKKLQSALASYAVLRGGTVISLLWYIDEKSGKTVCDMKAYDPMFCQWEEGDEEIAKFCHRNYVRKAWFERTFKEQLKKESSKYGQADSVGGYLTYTFWDEEKWRIAVNGEWLTDEKEGWHGLGYIPVNIRSCGAVPYLRSGNDKWQDTMKWAWQSYAMNSREIYPVESKLLSIQSSNAIESGRRTAIGVHDSSKSNDLNEDIKKVGYGTGQRNKFIFLDTAKGQDFKGFAEAPDNRIADSFYSRVRTDLDIVAGLDAATLRALAGAGNASLAAELRSAAEEYVSIFRECGEEDFKWWAEECVSQFKNEDRKYEKISVEGRDRRREKFYADLEPKDVEERHFDCNLVADRLRDKTQEAGLQMQLIAAGLTSLKTAMVAGNIHANPDKEMDNMEEELASQDPVFKNRKLAKYFHDQGEDDMALYFQALSKIEIMRVVAGAGMEMQAEVPGGAGSKPPVITPRAPSPQAEIMRQTTAPQQITGVG